MVITNIKVGYIRETSPFSLLMCIVLNIFPVAQQQVEQIDTAHTHGWGKNVDLC